MQIDAAILALQLFKTQHILRNSRGCTEILVSCEMCKHASILLCEQGLATTHLADFLIYIHTYIHGRTHVHYDDIIALAYLKNIYATF